MLFAYINTFTFLRHLKMHMKTGGGGICRFKFEDIFSLSVIHMCVNIWHTSQRSEWGSVVACAWPSGAPIELQPALLPRRWQAAEVRAASPPLRTVLGDGTLPSSLHPPPHPERSSSQREWVWKHSKEDSGDRVTSWHYIWETDFFVRQKRSQKALSRVSE